MFKVGDRIRCIKSTTCGTRIFKGKEYFVHQTECSSINVSDPETGEVLMSKFFEGYALYNIKNFELVHRPEEEKEENPTFVIEYEVPEKHQQLYKSDSVFPSKILQEREYVAKSIHEDYQLLAVKQWQRTHKDGAFCFTHSLLMELTWTTVGWTGKGIFQCPECKQ